jgi:predicted TIM-barrel fold metal-dependent hydrolase
MDADSVVGGVLYASQGLHLYRAVPDTELLSAIFRAYNDWMADFCKPYPNRLKGIAMLNVDEVEDAVGELQRIAKLGLAGAMIPVRPEKRYDDPRYDPLWAAAQDLSMPLSLHVSTQRQRPGMEVVLPIPGDPVEALNRDADPKTAIGSLIFGGVFERFPRLKVGAVEFEVAWAPFFVRRMDIVYKERPSGLKGKRFANGALPSDIFRRNVFVSFQEDSLGVELRAYMGADNLMWGSDYPHAESTFPKSREIVERVLKNVPEQDKIKIAGSNAAKLYNFN